MTTGISAGGPNPFPPPSPAPASVSSVSDSSLSAGDADRSSSERRTRRTSKAKKKKKTTVVAAHDRVRLYAIQKERLLEFNLELDINNLKQEIRDLDAMRNILLATRYRGNVAKALAIATPKLSPIPMPRYPAQTHSNVVNEFYHQFHHWVTPDKVVQQQQLARQIRCVAMASNLCVDDVLSLKRKRSTPKIAFTTASEQKQFLDMTMHANIDCCDGIVGVEAMWQQIQSYGQFMRPLWLQLKSLQIVHLDHGASVVKSHGNFRTQVQRITIETVFPHVLSHNDIVAQLVDQVFETTCELNFYFDRDGKVTRYEVILDLVTPFLELLSDPAQVAILLGNAHIGSNYAIDPPSHDGSRNNTNTNRDHDVEQPEAEEKPTCRQQTRSDVEALYSMDGRLITCEQEENDGGFVDGAEIFV